MRSRINLKSAIESWPPEIDIKREDPLGRRLLLCFSDLWSLSCQRLQGFSGFENSDIFLG
ncbi:hypothetical protein EV07_1967 [Prochlorococcus sp. MIT 0603]|nr:hypothetical protein EV07_1967 [Prochlorococcus sp. MIT 0603]